MSEIQGRFARRGYKGIFLLKGNAFLGFHVTSASSFFPPAVSVSVHSPQKKVHEIKSLLLKTGQ